MDPGLMNVLICRMRKCFGCPNMNQVSRQTCYHHPAVVTAEFSNCKVVGVLMCEMKSLNRIMPIIVFLDCLYKGMCAFPPCDIWVYFFPIPDPSLSHGWENFLPHPFPELSFPSFPTRPAATATYLSFVPTGMLSGPSQPPSTTQLVALLFLITYTRKFQVCETDYALPILRGWREFLWHDQWN